MSVLDIGIIVFILLGAALGFKRGFLNQSVKTIGLVAVLVVAFLFKGIVSEFLYNNLPFFNFYGEIKGVQVLNILLYEMLAFLIIFFVALFGLRILLMASTFFEAILNATIVLGFTSKIGGALVGLLYHFFITFIVLYILSLPIFGNNYMKNSTLGERILTDTVFISKYTDNAYSVLKEFNDLKNQYKVEEDPNKFNLDALDVFLKYGVVDVETVDNLVIKGKLEINQIETVLVKYREEK